MTAKWMPGPTQSETDSSRFINLLACLAGHLLGHLLSCSPTHSFACPLNTTTCVTIETVMLSTQSETL